LLALILMASPVAGLRPIRAGRLRTCRMPRPPILMRLPFFRCLGLLDHAREHSVHLRLRDAWLWARVMASCFNVTVSTFAAVFTGATLGMLGSIVCMWGPLLRCAPKETAALSGTAPFLLQV
jgi:hypothetical protein